jgi:hypothetical protein
MDANINLDPNRDNLDWSGWLVKPKEKWLNPGEAAHPYVVIEDRGPRILIRLLPQYQPKNLSFPCIECGFKEWYDVVDTEIQNYETNA